MPRKSRYPLTRKKGAGFSSQDAPPITRFAVSVMDGRKMIRSASDAHEFLTGLASLIKHEPMCALERMLSSSGVEAIRTALTINIDTGFWEAHIVPLLEALSSDDLQTGSRLHLTTTVFQSIIEVPFFLQRFSANITDGIIDPLLAFSIVDRVGTDNMALRDEQKFLNVIQAVCEKLDGRMRNHLCAKFLSRGAASTDVLRDTSVTTLREMKFDRHDNDFENINDIGLLPSKEEVDCTRPPYMLDARDLQSTVPALFEKHFRWLREDILAPIRTTLAMLRPDSSDETIVKNHRAHQRLKSLTFGPVLLKDIFCSDRGTGIHVSFPHPRPFNKKKHKSLSDVDLANRAIKHYERYWRDNSNTLRRGSIVAFVRSNDGDLVRFGEVCDGNRPKNPPETDGETGFSTIGIAFEPPALQGAISDMITGNEEDILMVQLSVSFFAYKPVLQRLQQMRPTPLTFELLPHLKEGQSSGSPEKPLQALVDRYPKLQVCLDLLSGNNTSSDIRSVLPDFRGPLTLDKQQLSAVEHALTAPIALIQGPPGTGKSLCGAIVVALLHKYTNLRMLCLCYTNHALDAFLTDLRKAGIALSEIVRIGFGSRADANSDIAKMHIDSISAQSNISAGSIRRLKAQTYEMLNEQQRKINEMNVMMEGMRRQSWSAVSRFLELHQTEDRSAFTITTDNQGFSIKGVSEKSLWKTWISGGNLPENISLRLRTHPMWSLKPCDRQKQFQQWVEETASLLTEMMSYYDDCKARLQSLHDEEKSAILQKRRIIGCTTTGASSFSRLLDGSKVDVLIVEEAAEILEAHVLGALNEQVEHVVMIGDHLQLRPKIQNYLLGIDPSNGSFALDVSLFERLVDSGVSHVTLEEQHRMCKSISAFVTELTYPKLRCAASVPRGALIGVPHNVVFVNHSEQEGSSHVYQTSESAFSRTNAHEVEWICALTRYFLCQPEYKPSDIVVLTPYLGQVVLIREALAKSTKTGIQLNERDTADLAATGATVPDDVDSLRKQSERIRVATVDNFQGEEGRIIVASLVRSNDQGQIGFVGQPQRINVLLSRAREAMVFIGNSSTLTSASRGGGMWKHIVKLFEREGNVTEGIVLSCVKHKKQQIIRSPSEMLTNASDGGCELSCEATLKCGHPCERKCHRGVCTQRCSACDAVLEARRKQEEAIRRNEALRTKHKTKLAQQLQELDSRRLSLAEKQDEMQQKLELEKMKLERDLLERESQLVQDSNERNLKAKISRLRNQHEKDVESLQSRFSTLSSETSSAVGRFDTPCQQKEGRKNDLCKGPPSTMKTGKPPSPSKEHPSTISDESETEISFTAEDFWKTLRLRVRPDQRNSMDKLMELIGLGAVKKVAVDIFKKQLADEKLMSDGFQSSVVQPTLNFVFSGNPGTGKTTVARLFAGILAESGARFGKSFEQISASEALRLGENSFAARITSLCGADAKKAPPVGRVLRRNLKVQVQGTDKKWYAATVSRIDDEKENTYTVQYTNDGTEESQVGRQRIRAGVDIQRCGGVLFIDEAYNLAPSRNPTGAAIVNALMEAAEEHRDVLTIILAGYKKDIEEQLFAFNDGMPSRFREVPFEDFDEDEFCQIWDSLCASKSFSCARKVTSVAARRIARGSGTRGFGNARAMRSLFETACTRALGNRKDSQPTIDVVDVIGPRPTLQDRAIRNVIDELNGLLGLPRVKKSFKSLIDVARSNYDREVEGRPLVFIPLNRVFTGNPGTGKTTVARLYGLLLKALGFLTNGEVVSKVASDLMGQYVGQSQQRTKAIVENARGKVLLIDEAYGLDDDMYGKQALDAIVERVSGAPGDDIAVVLVGYEAEIRRMIDGQNPGLRRRFSLEHCMMVFDDLNREELHTLVAQECQKKGVELSDDVHEYATKLLMKQRAMANFGNAGNVINIVSSATARLMTRCGSIDAEPLSILDFSPHYAPDANPMAPLQELEDTPVKHHLLGLAQQIHVRKKDGRSTDGLLGNMVFTGAPGTGKTTVSRQIAKVLFNLGVLASDRVVETSSSDLIGAYVGHSRANVEKKMKEARGGVCFIDEAYHLGVGSFGDEALTMLLTMLTLEEYANGKTVVILAGYKKEMHQMLQTNPGLKSRFGDYVHFDDWDTQKCISFIHKLASKESPRSFEVEGAAEGLLRNGFDDLMARPGWANARDVIQLYKKIMSESDQRRSCEHSTMLKPSESSGLVLTMQDVRNGLARMLLSRPLEIVGEKFRQTSPQVMELPTQTIVEQRQADTKRSKVIHEQHNHSSEELCPSERIEEQALEEALMNEADETSYDCPDEIALYDALLLEMEELRQNHENDLDEKHRADFSVERDRLQKLRNKAAELSRQKREAEERARQAAEEKEREKAREEARQREAEIQRQREKERKRQQIRHALMSIGKCVQGFAWRHVGNGYQCMGGSHFASFEQIAFQTGFTTAEIDDAFKA